MNECDHDFAKKWSYDGLQRECSKCGRYEAKPRAEPEPFLLSVAQSRIKICLDLIDVANRRGTQAEALEAIRIILEHAWETGDEG